MKPQKKVWTKPEIVDLDVKNTTSGTLAGFNESSFPTSSPIYNIYAPSVS